ncbi:MAG TPA: metalloregulator ArsR/SmtB family transcription factor [Candidatus Woesebacteria bacterium]|nr:metalloregulator ArsR/SmtB family transcription factor [Candidatus Woesebacteria bacterium]
MDIFQALAEPNRRKILEIIAKNGELSASDIFNKFDSTAPAISQHLKVLRVSNLVMVEKRAQQRIYKINTEPLLEMESWIKEMTKLWNEKFDALDALLQEEKKKLL